MTRINSSIYRSARRQRHRLPILLGLAAAGALAVAVQRKVRKAQRDNPPQGNFIEIEGVRLHYLERGAGPPLVLLHGNGTMMQDFQLSGLIDVAARNHRVIVFDRPGYGWSTRPRTRIWGPVAQARLLHKALELLGVQSATVMGHSWGTLVALALALEQPRAVDRLVLLSGYYFPTLRLDVPVLAPPAIPIIGDLMRYTLSPWLGRLLWPHLLKAMFDPAPVPKRFESFPKWMALRPSQLRAAAAESALMVPSVMALQRRYQELGMPVTIVAGAGDRVASAQHQSQRLHEQLSRSHLHLVSGTGHMVHHTALPQVLAAMGLSADTNVEPPSPSASARAAAPPAHNAAV